MASRSKRPGDLGIVEIDTILRSYSQSFLTDPSPNNWCDCVAGLECFIDIIRALKMGSCLSADTRAQPRPPGSSIKKRRSSKTSSFESLPKIPGRLFRNGSTHVASLCTQQGRKGTNQDAMIVWENFASRADTIFCGVFDGHGPFGHLVARRVRDSLPLKLSTHYDVDTDAVYNANHSFSEDSSYVSADESVSDTVFQTLKESFLKAFSFMDRELRSQPTIDCFCSGTTAVTMIKQGDYLMVGNVGDSRAVLATRADDGGIYPHQLTVDLKPNLPEEAERIRRCKGRVFALRDEPDVARVWLPNNDSPGLAMARAFGDFCLKDYGLISVPDITYRCLTEKDEFVVLASDGIWDVLSNKEVVDIVATSYPRSYAAKLLVETAVSAWRQKYPTSKVDDCAVVCLFLSPNVVAVASDVEVDGGLNVEGGSDWSALEGVSRVNTLLNLPRFVPHR